MRIAQVAPLYEAVPPKGYGGTERVVSFLTEELVRQGHEVTLFATGDSSTKARLISPWPAGIRLSQVRDSLALHVLLADEVMRHAEEFDVVHFHADHIHLPLTRHGAVPIATTMHGRLDLPEVPALLRRFPDAPMISISDAQRSPVPDLNWRATIHHGLPRDLLQAQSGADGYLAFLGRIAPEKGVERAVEIATRAGMPLKIAAKIEPGVEEEYVASVQPLFAHPLVDFVGEIGEGDKQDFLGRAAALLFPIDWPEPFGLVMIEAMACGTPVVAFACGSVPEVVEHGVSGFVVDGIDAAVDHVGRLQELDRATVRAAFDRRFTAERMARDHVRVYDELVAIWQGAAWTHARDSMLAHSPATSKRHPLEEAPAHADGPAATGTEALKG